MLLKDGAILFHGSSACFFDIQLDKQASPYKDFGRGFYLTSYFLQARKHAMNKARKAGGKRAYVYKYEVRGFDPKSYRVLELLEYDRAWLDFIKENRVYGRCSSPDLDIVYDRIADSYGATLDDALRTYAEGKKPASKVIDNIVFPNPGDQYCFKTGKAIGLLFRLECKTVQM